MAKDTRSYDPDARPPDSTKPLPPEDYYILHPTADGEQPAHTPTGAGTEDQPYYIPEQLYVDPRSPKPAPSPSTPIVGSSPGHVSGRRET